MVRIATWNLCLGLINKKDKVLRELNNNSINICCLQETELDENFPVISLNSNEYFFEPELNANKKRVGFYINKQISYIRRTNLEDKDSHLLIIDMNTSSTIRIIGLYQTFRSPDGSKPIDFFLKQINIIKRNFTSRTVLLGDFNLDARMQYRLDYSHKHIFVCLGELLGELNLHQMVDFPTWSCIINDIKKESILDHIYVNDITLIEKCSYTVPYFGDHVIVTADLWLTYNPPEVTIKRDWHNYTPEKLKSILDRTNLIIENDSVQEYWNCLENVSINVNDHLAPLVEFKLQPFKK
jgi:hypothetical protein